MIRNVKTTTSNLIFLVVVVLHLIGIHYSENLAFITKPLLITTLVIIYLVSVKKANFWYVSALFFSFWGDVLLLFKNQFFVFGLGSFLIAHILYIKLISEKIKKTNWKQITAVMFPFLLYLIFFLFVILDKVIDVKLPVIVYGLVISTFGFFSLLSYLQSKSTANLWLFLGALFFILSDSLIALNRFYQPKEYYQMFIMVTYILAQYLICKSFIAKAFLQE